MTSTGVFAIFGPLAIVFALALARISALVLVAPFFGSQSIPMVVKMGLVGTLTLFVVAHTPAGAGLSGLDGLGNLHLLKLAGMVAAEMLVGALMGLAVASLFGALALAGQLIGTQMGLSMANLVDPMSFQQTGLMTQVINVLALFLFLSMDGHLLLLRALFESFDLAPLGQVMPRGESILPELMSQGAALFSVGLRLALPVVITLLLVNLAMAIVARTVPQVNVFQLGFILTIGLGFFVLALSLPGLGQAIGGLFDGAVRAALRLARAC